MKRHFYVWCVPLVFAVVSLLSFQWPGDEYALWVASSIVGVWWGFIFQVGDIQQWHIPWLTAAVGMVVLAPLGWALDRLRLDRRLWLGLLVVGTIGMFLWSILSYESIDRAIRKNGSLQAYLLASINMGLYLSIIMGLLIGLAQAGLRRRRKNAH